MHILLHTTMGASCSQSVVVSTPTPTSATSLDQALPEALKSSVKTRDYRIHDSERIILEDAVAQLMTYNAKLERLKHINAFVLDNSIRETTVAAVRGHTFEDKMKIAKAVIQDCGFENAIIATFNANRSVEDAFAEVAPRRWSPRGLFAFSEVADSFTEGVPDLALPIGLIKCQRYGIQNVILELDLIDRKVDWSSYTVDTYCNFVASRLAWIRSHLNASSRVFVNIRDLPVALSKESTRTETFLKFLCNLAPSIRPEGIMTEDGTGECLPFVLGRQMAFIRAMMSLYGWHDGEILLHAHYGYGLADANVLEAIACGASGIWGGICKEGAGVGHASSLMLLTNLARLGNVNVQQKYNFPKLREAAILVTNVVTGAAPHPMTELVGTRALDKLWDPSIMSFAPFDIVQLFDGFHQVRVSTFTTPQMFQDKLAATFGVPTATDNDVRVDDMFPISVCEKMLHVIQQDLLRGRKENYDTAAGLCFLFERAGGRITPEMEHTVINSDSKVEDPLVLKLYDYFLEICGAEEAPSLLSPLQLRQKQRSMKQAKQSFFGTTSLTDNTAPNAVAKLPPPQFTFVEEGSENTTMSNKDVEADPVAILSPRLRIEFVVLAKAAIRRRRLRKQIAKSEKLMAVLSSKRTTSYRNFYNGFLARYFTSFSTPQAQKALRLFDVDVDGHIAWAEVLTPALWAVGQYRDTMRNVDDLVDCIVQRFVFPEIAAEDT